MKKFKDQLGREISFEATPTKIVSLVPSITELLIDLGLEKSIIGRTKFCIYPEEKCKSIPRIGGTKNPRIDEIIKLEPDIVFANKEENLREHIDLLANYTNCYVSNIQTIEHALNMINDVGTICDKKSQSNQLITAINNSRNSFPKNKEKAIYLIWNKPYMSIGHDTYISSFLNEIGYQNILPQDTVRYPTLSLEEIKQLSPDKLLLSDEPFPFKEKHQAELQSLLPNTKVELINGSYCSWYGSRMLEALEYFKLKNA
jgi:ABC-type Fe3+-hydroxamate transport system substrate-binding protein